MTGGLPFCMLAFHRLVDRATVATRRHARRPHLRAGARVRVLRRLRDPDDRPRARCSSRSREGCGDRATTGSGIGLAAFVSIALHVPVLPAVPARAAGDGLCPHARRRAAVLGERSARGSRRMPGRTAGGCRALGDFNEVLFPGVLTTGALASPAPWQFLRKRGLSPLSQNLQRDVALLYVLIAVIAFWSSFGPDAGLYWLLLQDDSDLHVHARAGADGHHGGARADRARARRSSRRCSRGRAGRSSPVRSRGRRRGGGARRRCR